MSEYKDYGYTDEGGTTYHDYLYQDLKALLNINANKYLLDIDCENGYLTKKSLLMRPKWE